MLTNQSIIELVGAEVPETVIIGHIRASKTKFDLSTEEIITLSKNDVPAAVIEAMRNPTGKAAAPLRPRFRPAAVAAADTRLVPLLGGVPFEITLMEEVPNDPAPGAGAALPGGEGLSGGRRGGDRQGRGGDGRGDRRGQEGNLWGAGASRCSG